MPGRLQHICPLAVLEHWMSMLSTVQHTSPAVGHPANPMQLQVSLPLTS
jgi:hypothetical protein